MKPEVDTFGNQVKSNYGARNEKDDKNVDLGGFKDDRPTFLLLTPSQKGIISKDMGNPSVEESEAVHPGNSVYM
ncbi:unnamed protein product [Cuscuta campestris]|uniref:Uncharacterized protein n=1 Tax=Cuscuta campestris TaxID=132261 RepID=A0A484NMV5_9ASTE|nr:unnamed protein product [Cuscuta campestris]